ncbi:hypothetical protein [Leptospira noguchii]|uniref:hypothetical protein n=1 Tax=Leptospira noguchii TaxID=28182 RepID=UPI001FB7650E|nr:hypothetical protein [Leptospira noguchii]UOG54568.1 hypothetical protein MAL09_06320 [Leptospira noguchii]
MSLIFLILIANLTSHQTRQSSQIKVPKSTVNLVINHSGIAKFFHPEVKDAYR